MMSGFIRNEAIPVFSDISTRKTARVKGDWLTGNTNMVAKNKATQLGAQGR